MNRYIIKNRELGDTIVFSSNDPVVIKQFLNRTRGLIREGMLVAYDTVNNKLMDYNQEVQNVKR